MTLKVSIIGVGGIAFSHIEAIQTIPEFTLVSICDSNPQRLQQQAEQLRCKGYANYHDLLGTRPDVVVVCLPHHLHCPVTLDALAAGCHVLVEKPMANSVEQCNQMLAAARTHGKVIAVGETASFAPGPRLTGQKFKTGQLGGFLSGSIINARYYFTDTRPDWFLDPAASGGGMFSNVGLHRLATTSAALPGLEARTVSASVGYLPEYKVEACTTALVKYAPTGAMLYEEVGYFPKPSWMNLGTHLIFEQGIVMWDQQTWRMMQRNGKEHEESLHPDPVLYRPVYKNLLHAIEGKDCERPAEENAAHVAIAQATYAASRQEGEVDLTQEPWRIIT